MSGSKPHIAQKSPYAVGVEAGMRIPRKLDTQPTAKWAVGA